MVKSQTGQVFKVPTAEQVRAAEEQIRELQADVDYDTREYPVEVVVSKYLRGLTEGENELFVPDYQRDMAWTPARQSKFVESVLIGLPVPYIFVADVGDGLDEGGRLEIVDGSQRVRTLARFVEGELPLTELAKLTRLDGFRFHDLPRSRQRRFNRHTIRMIELTEKANEDVRRDIFERINTGSVELEDMEKRRGIQQGQGLELVEWCAQMPLFDKVVPLTTTQKTRRDREELVLRFFAYRAGYLRFKNRVGPFLDSHLKEMNKKTPAELGSLKQEFERVLSFVDTNFPHGFAKAKSSTTTPRVRFEAISVGAALAMAEIPALTPVAVDSWLDGSDFRELTTSGSSNSRPRIKARIEYVRDQLLAAKSE